MAYTRNVFATNDCAFPIKVTQDPRTRLLCVEYGLERHEGLDYTQAAHKLGEAIFHGKSCLGAMDNR